MRKYEKISQDLCKSIKRLSLWIMGIEEGEEG
jgi:hypothetical protein